MTCVPGTDITILGLMYASALPPDALFHQAPITTRLPRVGEKLMISGFLPAAHYAEASNPGVLECRGNIVACSGEVVTRYPTGRDSCMLPWPVLEVNCPSWGGMSGGPVFDHDGKLVGLLSSSFEEGPSYISLLWPALSATFVGGWPMDHGPTSLLSLDALCEIDKRGAIDVHDSHVHYRMWEEA